MTEKHFCLDDSPDFRMVELGEVTSTNDFLRNYRPVGPERRLTLVTAEYQTAGRGAGSNRWESRKGENLLFSMLVHPRHIPADRAFALSEMLALAIRDAIASFLLPPTSDILKIKWPNDIYWGDNKICGMLIENELKGSQIERCVLGAGININQAEFEFDRMQQDGLRHIAEPVSLAQIVGEGIERRFVLERVVEYFTRYYGEEANDIHELYMSRLYRFGEKHDFQDKSGIFRGTIVDVEPTGNLIITDEMGQNRSYAFKEVEYVI